MDPEMRTCSSCLCDNPCLSRWFCGCVAAFGGALLAAPARADEAYDLDVAEAQVLAPREMDWAVSGMRRDGDMRLPLPAWGAAPGTATLLRVGPQVGLGNGWQVGAELQANAAADGRTGAGGAAVLAKWTLPLDADGPLQVAVAGQWAQQDRSWSAELRPIATLQAGALEVAVNPVLVWSADDGATLAPCGRISWPSTEGYSLGIEYYADLGSLAEGRGGLQSQALLASLDLSWNDDLAAQPWHLHAAGGPPLGADSLSDWAVKATLVRAF